MIIDILIGTIILCGILIFCFLLIIHKLKKRISKCKINNINLSHDLKSLLATFRFALDGLKMNKCFKIAMENKEQHVRGGLSPLIEVFDGIGHELSKLIQNNESINELYIIQCKEELK